MCRIFGFRSVIDSKVHSSLVEAENALVNQSSFHADGWGVAYYLANTPHVVKSDRAAMNDSLFTKVSGVVSAKTVIAHLRKSTIGDISAVNTHPFQHGQWTFAHNGNIKNFAQHHDKLHDMVAPKFRKYMLGTTDSEFIFYLILTELNQYSNVYHPCRDLEHLKGAAKTAIAKIIDLIGPVHTQDDGPPTETYLSFVMTNGTFMLALNGGKTLYYSTYKTKCPERETCGSFNPFCEQEANGNAVNHLIFSSEPLHGENIWKPLELGQMMAIDAHMKLHDEVIF